MNTKAMVDGLIARHGFNEAAVIAILQEIQEQERYLPPDALRALAETLDVQLARVHSVATFYRAFSLEPKGRHVCSVCTGTACHVRGAPRLLDRLERDLRVKPGQTTADGRFTLQTVNCVGACALAPLVVVDEDHHGKMSTSRVPAMVKGYR